MSVLVRRCSACPLFLVLLAVFCSVSPAVRGTDLGGDWVARFPTPTVSDLYDVATDGSARVVAVGTRGAILSSADMTTWTTINTGVQDDFLNVIYNGSQYAAVGSLGHVLTSPNGVNWNTRTPSSVSSDVLECIVWTGTKFIVGGAYVTSSNTSAGLVLTSVDGVTWQRITLPAMKPIKRIVWTGSLLVGLMSGSTATSLDGSTWAVHNLPASAANGGTSTVSLVWTGSQLLVSGSTLWSSVNGLDWSETGVLVNGALLNAVGVRLAWTGTELVMTNNNFQLLRSTDQVNFTDFSSSLPASEIGITRFGTSLVAVGIGGHIDTQVIGTSPGTWSPRNNQTTPIDVQGVAKSPGLFVAVGVGCSWTSTDGTTWTQHPLSGNSFRTVAWSGSQFVAAGSGVWTSPDGVTWTVNSSLPADSTGNQVWFSVNWVNGKGYASGYNYTTATAMCQISSDNGATWAAGGMTELALGMATDGAATNPVIVAVGAAGAVMVSNDNGVTWTNGQEPLSSGEDFRDVAYGNSRFIAVTTGGAIWNSTDGGNTWTRAVSAPISLMGITRTPDEFVIGGSSGNVLRSFDGIYWRTEDSTISQSIQRVLWSGMRLVGVAASGVFVTSDGTPDAPPTVQFTTDSSSITEGGSVGLVVTLSKSWNALINVPLTFSGTAASSRYAAPASPIVFKAFQTSQYIVVSTVDDHVQEGPQTIVLTLGAPTGGVTLGAMPAHTIHVADNDLAPAFTTPPQDQLVALNAPVTFSEVVTGTGTLTYQWKKNGVAISGAKSASYTIAKAAAASMGAYSVAVTGDSGSATSAATTGRLGVVTVLNSRQVVKAGAAATFTATVTAPAGLLSYQWSLDTGSGPMPLGDVTGHRTGSGTAKLSLTGSVLADSGIYTCKVTMGSGTGAPSMVATTMNYSVINGATVIDPPAVITTQVASNVDFTPTATESPTSWAISGLPAGLTYNTATGRITGKPTVAGSYKATLKATNLYGPSAAVSLAINVSALPSVVQGSFIVVLPRDVPNNGNLGGRVDLTTTSNGAFSGSLTFPATAVAFTGSLTGDPATHDLDGAASVKVGSSTVGLAFVIDHTTGVLSLTATAGANAVNATAQALVAGTISNIGTYNFALEPDSSAPAGHPGGDGYGQCTVVSTSTKFTVAGKLPDGTAYTTSTGISADGSIPVYASINAGKGSLLGYLHITLDNASNFVNNAVTGPLTWYKTADATSRSYASGIPLMQLNVDGGRYTAPGGSPIVMNLIAGAGNATLTFTGASLGTAAYHPSGNFTVAAPAKVTPPSPNQSATTLSFATTTGLFSGQFKLVDPDTSLVSHPLLTRTTLYYGILIRPGGQATIVGKGFFNLANMPTATPHTTSSTSPLVSGEVTLSQAH